MRMKLLAAAISGIAAFGAQATTVDWGAHDDAELVAILAGPGSFSDTITFTIPGLSDVTSTTVANNLLAVYNITGGQVELFREEGAVDTSLLTYSFDGTTGSTSHVAANLTGGSYYYQITGTATGSHGGFYSVTSTVSPVPEPETYALMLAGLGVVASLYRRRKQD